MRLVLTPIFRNISVLIKSDQNKNPCNISKTDKNLHTPNVCLTYTSYLDFVSQMRVVVINISNQKILFNVT